MKHEYIKHFGPNVLIFKHVSRHFLVVENMKNVKIVIFYSAKEIWKPRGSKILPSREDWFIVVILELGFFFNSMAVSSCTAPAGTAHSLSLFLDSACQYCPARHYFWHRLNWALPQTEIKRYCLSINCKWLFNLHVHLDYRKAQWLSPE